jgi:mannose-6-phosphate isomerase
MSVSTPAAAIRFPAGARPEHRYGGRVQAIVGEVQHYAWGDPVFLPRLLGVEPDGRPWAEWWLGTHPVAPSSLADGRPLADVTGPLPYLLKVLAAAEPLSLQTHPTADQARDGFARGVLPDDAAKPELLCALTDFEAFCGVRPAAATLALLEELGATDLAGIVRTDGPGAALVALYRGRLSPDAAVAACERSDRPEAVWVRRLESRYPGDPSVAATLLLNHVRLAPGDAIHLAAGNLHAYLGGAGIELMGASDNVVRGGLTVKPVDVDLLLEIVDPTPLEHPVERGPARCHALAEVGVTLERIDAGDRHRADGHELAVDLDGGAWYVAPGDELTATATTYVVRPSR